MPKSFTLISVVVTISLIIQVQQLDRSSWKAIFFCFSKPLGVDIGTTPSILHRTDGPSSFLRQAILIFFRNWSLRSCLAAALNPLPAQITCQKPVSIAIPCARLIVLSFCAYCSFQAIVLCDIVMGLRSGSLILAR